MKNSSKRLLPLALASLLAACGGENSTVTPAPHAAAPALAPTPAPYVFTGKRADYTISRTAAGFIVTDASNKSVTVTGTIVIQFADVRLNLAIGDKAASMNPADLKSLIDLYVAFFNRIPEADGLAYWIDQVKAGMTFDQVADNFYQAALQYTSLTGYSSTMSNADFVKIVYKNVLGRSGATAPPQGDVDYWATQLDKGYSSKGKLVSTMLTAARGYANDAAWGWVARLLDNKVSVANYFATEQGLNYNTPEESISKTVSIVAAITADNIATAKTMIGMRDKAFNLGLSPTGTGIGNLNDCINPEMYTAGNTYQYDVSTRTDLVTVTGSMKYKVNGTATFKGNGATELEMQTQSSTPQTGPVTATVKSYVGLTQNALNTYGGTTVSNLGNFGTYTYTVSNSPVISVPLGLAVNTPYTQSYTTLIESSSDKGQISTSSNKITATTTFLGEESVTVPAGTFMACKILSDETSQMSTSLVVARKVSYSWLVASGRYRGMFVKSADGEGGLMEVTRLLFNGS